MIPLRMLSAAAALFAVTAQYTHAEQLQVDGFITLSGGMATDDTFTRSGYENSFDINIESLAAVQGTVEISPQLRATAQVIARGREDWDVELEWAYLSYDINDAWRVNIGQQRVPYFLYSEVKDVGYAYPWITPPNNVYDVPTDKYDGINVMHQYDNAGWYIQTQLVYGEIDERFSVFGFDNVRAEANHFFGGQIQLEYSELTVRVAHFEGKVTAYNSELDMLADIWRATGFDDVAESILLKDDRGHFSGIGLKWHGNRHKWWAEYTDVDYGESVFSDTEESYYVTYGYQWNEWLPHITVGRNHNTDNLVNSLSRREDVVATGELYQGSATLIQSYNDDVRFVSLGLRYEWSGSTTVKAEWTQEDNVLTSQDGQTVRVAMSVMF